MHPKTKKSVQESFESKESTSIIGFLERGFSENGQIVIGGIFLFAKEHGKPVMEVLQACESEWQRNWQYQHPEIKGDPDAPGGIGLKNRVSLENIYSALGMPSPLNRKPKPAPETMLVVKTRNSTYRLGRAYDDGRRSISRDEKPLDFTRCRVVNLSVGEDMDLECLDGPHPEWHTTTVLSIK